MLKLQVMTVLAYDRLRAEVGRSLSEFRADDRGEITSTVAIIGVLVIGALVAGAIVVARMEAHANAIPNPGTTP